jgi:GNAT superfamily N-acetyltransferase
MAAAPLDILRSGREQARTGRWRGDHRVALLAPVPSAPLPSPDFIRYCLQELASRGFSQVVTGALNVSEQVGFLDAGFAVAERLHLLTRDLTTGLPPIPAGPRLYRAGARHLEPVTAVDRAAFAPFWQLDRQGLIDASRATPDTRWTVSGSGSRWVVGSVDGYAICGRAASRGFVQRLAVEPSCQGRGIGTRLLLDGLHWMRGHGVVVAAVNTQFGNETALRLYQRIGFVEEPTGLSVLVAGL